MLSARGMELPGLEQRPVMGLNVRTRRHSSILTAGNFSAICVTVNILIKTLLLRMFIVFILLLICVEGEIFEQTDEQLGFNRFH